LVDNSVDVGSKPDGIDGWQSAEPVNQEPSSETPSWKRTKLGDGFSVTRDRHAFPRLHPPDHLPAVIPQVSNRRFTHARLYHP